MSKILNRNEYIKDIYEPIKEQKAYEYLKSVNEGLLKNLFGKIINLFKKDWASIKGDAGIISAYKEMDDKLSGFSSMKLAKKDQCNQIRQKLVDFACDWYDIKKQAAKNAERDIKPTKSLKFKDDTLKENLEKCKKSIKTIADGDTQMIKWAELLMDDMTMVINRVIINEIDDEEEKKNLQEQEKEELKKQEEINKKMEEFQNKQLEEVQKERETFISDAGASAIDIQTTGDKAIKTLCDEWEKITSAAGKLFESEEFNNDDDVELLTEAESAETKKDKENLLNALKNDSMLGFKDIFANTKKIGKSKFKPAYQIMSSFYTKLSDNDIIKKFEETPGQSVQAMCISVNSFIKNSVYGTDAEKQIPLMAKCAIVSNGIASYNLPVNDQGDGNYYTEIMGMIAEGKFEKDGKNKPIKYSDDFKKNADDMMKKIVEEAGKLKEEAEKKYDENMKSLKLDDNQDETNMED